VDQRTTKSNPLLGPRTRSWMGLTALSLPLLLLPLGCRAAVPGPLQWPVLPPPPLDARQPQLWVALAARLGTGPSAPPLQLRSAGAPLTLVDGRGDRWSGSQLTIRWQAVPLAQPLLLRRQVVGPFASFESAEHLASLWRARGVAVTVAQPREWEVWAPPGSPPPPQGTVRQVQERHLQAVVPVLAATPSAPSKRLVGPVQIQAPGGLRWQGAVYRGPFRLQADAHGSWTLVEQVPLERYLEGVVPHEIGAGSPPSALAAQAVLARTWALRNQHRYQADGYHLCASVQCQVYADPRQAGVAVRQAIASTRHQVLSWQGQPIHAVYHASNGGVAAGLEEAWAAASLPYLQPRFDTWGQVGALGSLPLAPARLAALLQQRQPFPGSDHPLFRWRRSLEAPQLAAALVAAGLPVGQVQRLAVLERSASGRVQALEIEGSAGRTVLRLDAIRRTLRRLPSTLFTLRPQGAGRWLVEGGGFGHGVGLSQAGAIALARRGWSYGQILARYYPGTRLQTLDQLHQAPHGSAP
jgi:SpoIID/LytB domain protein